MGSINFIMNSKAQFNFLAKTRVISTSFSFLASPRRAGDAIHVGQYMSS